MKINQKGVVIGFLFSIAVAICSSGCAEKPFDHEAALKKMSSETIKLQRLFNDRSRFNRYTNKLLNKMGGYFDGKYLIEHNAAPLKLEIVKGFKFGKEISETLEEYGNKPIATLVNRLPLSENNIYLVWYGIVPVPENWNNTIAMKIFFDDGKMKKSLQTSNLGQEEIIYVKPTRHIAFYEWKKDYSYIYYHLGEGGSSGPAEIMGITKEGIEEKLLDVGGWQAEVFFIDLDEDAVPEIIYKVRGIPQEVKDSIIKEMKVTQNDAKIYQVLDYCSTVKIFRFNKKAFVNAGEYYIYY